MNLHMCLFPRYFNGFVKARIVKLCIISGRAFLVKVSGFIAFIKA